MKITEAELRQIICKTIVECYGWPVEKEEHLYGVKPALTASNPKDPKNPEIKMPKGPNTRSAVNEAVIGLNQIYQVKLAEKAEDLGMDPTKFMKKVIDEMVARFPWDFDESSTYEVIKVLDKYTDYSFYDILKRY